MHARVGVIQMSPRTFDQGIRMMRTQALPTLRLLEGFRGVVLVGDRDSGKALYLTLWETEDALRRSEEEAAILRDDSREALGVDEIPVERYEVFLAEVPAP